MRCPLAHQIRRPEKAFRAGRRFFGFVGKKFVRIVSGTHMRVCVRVIGVRVIGIERDALPNDGPRNNSQCAAGIHNNRTNSKRVAKPAQRKSRGLRDAHHVPASGNGVTESVDAAARIVRG